MIKVNTLMHPRDVYLHALDTGQVFVVDTKNLEPLMKTNENEGPRSEHITCVSLTTGHIVYVLRSTKVIKTHKANLTLEIH